MLTFSSRVARFVRRSQVRKIIAVTSAVWVLGTVASSAARAENATVRLLGDLESVIAPALRRQVNVVPFSRQHDSAILLQGRTMSQLQESHTQELRETYQAGYTIVLLDATMAQINALHGIIAAGVTYGSTDEEGVLAYTLRHEHHIPTATLVSHVPRSPLHPPSGEPDPTGLRDEKVAFNRAADRTVSELRHRPKVSVPEPRDPSQPTDWQSSPVQYTQFLQNGPTGVYNTMVSLYAL
jgi:hypothetical protein